MPARFGPECALLKVKAELHGFDARGDVVRATERRQKVVQRDFVGHVDYGEPQAPPIAALSLINADPMMR